MLNLKHSISLPTNTDENGFDKSNAKGNEAVSHLGYSSQGGCQNASFVCSGNYISTEAPVPFEDIITPFIETARQELQRVVGADLSFLSVSAQTTLERGLLIRLSDVALPVLMSEFNLFKYHRAIPAWHSQLVSDTVYYQFVAAIQNASLDNIRQEYPALIQVLEDLTSDWVNAQSLMIKRLKYDWLVIKQDLSLPDSVQCVQDIQPYQSDPHNRGQSVAILHFSGHKKIVYKPRSMDMEMGLNSVLNWANIQGFTKPFRIIHIIKGESYGWMEYVEARECLSQDNFTDYYHRIGALICIVTLLQGTDIHHENLIAAGDQPVLVDAETLFHPDMLNEYSQSFSSNGNIRSRTEDLDRALTNSGFFPTNHKLDFSALGAIEPIDTPFLIRQCKNINSDNMHIANEIYRAPTQNNTPQLKGVSVNASYYHDAILQGYREMFKIVMEHREAILQRVRCFSKYKSRYIIRSTNIYGLILHNSVQRSLLRNKTVFENYFNTLKEIALVSPNDSDDERFFVSEIEALKRMDVPHLLWPCEKKTKKISSPFEQVMRRINQLSLSELTAHLSILSQKIQQLPSSKER